MTNTYMRPGKHAPEEIIALGASRGIYAVNFGGGQVDITSGKFVFSASEAYLIENGKIGAPIKGATLDRQRARRAHARVDGRQRSRSSTTASAPAARKGRACRWAWASRRCASTQDLTVGGTG